MEIRPAEQQRCRVKRWRGYVKSSFYVEAPAGGLLFESSGFRWRHREPPPDEGAARLAYDSLVSLLLAAGWEPEGQGPLWFDARFVHRGVEAAPAAMAEAQAISTPGEAQDVRRRLAPRGVGLRAFTVAA